MISLSTDSSMDVSTPHSVDNITSANHCNGTYNASTTNVGISIPNIIVIMIALLLTGILNSILLTVFLIDKRLHTTPNAFIASLASAEVLFTAISCVFYVYQIDVYKTQGQEDKGMMKAFTFTLSVTTYSLYPSHFFISLERWAYIVRPFAHQRIVSPRSTALTIISVWAFAIFSSMDTLMKGYGSLSTEYRIRFQLALPCAHFLMCIILCIIYSHIAVVTRRQVSAIQRTHTKPSVGNNDNLASLKTTWKNVRMLVIVFGSYFILNTPFMVMQLYAYRQNTEAAVTMGVLFILTSQLGIMHYGATFFIYAYHDKDFRLAIWVLWRKFRSGCRDTTQVNPVTVNNTNT